MMRHWLRLAVALSCVVAAAGCDRSRPERRGPEPRGPEPEATTSPVKHRGAGGWAWTNKTMEPDSDELAKVGNPMGEDAKPEGPPPRGWPTFVDVAEEYGVGFTRHSGATGRKHYCEPKGGGVAFLDADGDGWPDIYLVDGGVLPGDNSGYRRSNRLFRNLEGRGFEDVTEKAGVAGIWYGMGAAAGDYDGDGHVDLFVTGVDGTVLYHNRGDGTFEDVTDEVGARIRGWTTTALFVDLDEDGFLDLYVTRYLDYHPAHNPPCYNSGVHNYCTPHDFQPLTDVVLHNEQGKGFEDVSDRVADHPLDGMGLMVAASDLDGDGLVDLYVANDEVPNFLLMNQGGGKFLDKALLGGVAVGSSGMAEAGMGVDIGDIDGDGKLDLVVANFAAQPVDYYRNLGGGLFSEESTKAGVFDATFKPLNFGTKLVDFDNDGDLDLYVCNGHIWDTVATFQPGMTFPQQNTIMRNEGGGRFTDLSSRSGPGMLIRRPSRGLAVADMDRDGDMDLIYLNQDAPAVLLRNDGGNRAPWLEVVLRGKAPNTAGIGAKVELHVGGKVLLREITTGGGYQSSNMPVAHFGLGKLGEPTKLVVRWPKPSGGVTVMERPGVNRILTVTQ